MKNLGLFQIFLFFSGAFIGCLSIIPLFNAGKIINSGVITLIALIYVVWIWRQVLMPIHQFESLIPTLIQYAQGSLDAATLPARYEWKVLSPLCQAVYSSASRAIEQQKEMSDRQEKLAKLEGVLETAQIVAHDVRQPLKLIEILLGMPKEMWNEKSVQEELRQSIAKAHSTLDDLLDYASPTQVKLSPIDLNDFLLKVHQSYRHHVRFQDLKVVNTAFATVVGEPSRLSRAFTNLLNNALAYSDANSPIEILAESGGRFETTLLIKNVCTNMTSQIFADFFEPMRSHHGGHGLGLVSIQANLESMGGSIQSEWSPPWIIFRVTLQNSATSF